MKTGVGCSIHPSVLIYGDGVEVGDNVRIDAFTIITGKVKIGSNIHIGCFGFLSGGYGIILEDYSQFAPRTTILTACDDFKGESMVGPMIPMQFKPTLKTGEVVIRKHGLLGASCVILPGVVVGEGCSVGALSMVSKSTEDWSVYAGVPAVKIGERSKRIRALEGEFEKWKKEGGFING
jgi:acetyltransferase-like isoleucine patch superfamily enzyme